MPKRRYERREPTHDWQEIRPLLKDGAQISYEFLRPVPPVGPDSEGTGSGNRHVSTDYLLPREPVRSSRHGAAYCRQHLLRPFPSKISGNCLLPSDKSL